MSVVDKKSLSEADAHLTKVGRQRTSVFTFI
jgi:hypothetical protein